MIQEILVPALAIGGMGLLFGGILAYASVLFRTNADVRIEQVTGCLPGANCGGCGYAGCSALAKAIVTEGARVSSCNLITEQAAREISEIMGQKPEKIVKKVARVACKGDCHAAQDKYEAFGLDDCRTAAMLGGGPKLCEFGCMGLGSCVKACQYDAIHVVDGVAVVDREACVGCGACANICPNGVIAMVPKAQNTFVACKSKDKGAVVKTYCQAGCIGCMICQKKCPHGAISVRDNLARIDYDKCTNCGVCAEACPKHIISFEV